MMLAQFMVLALVLALIYPLEATEAASPTKPPTINPTRTPSKSPTEKPTKDPTRTPTRSSTRKPTNAPVVSPNGPITSVPTKSPTILPTRAPSKSPTERPTKDPTRNPTRSTTAKPSVVPAFTPTTAPSQCPTVTPTTMPMEATAGYVAVNRDLLDGIPEDSGFIIEGSILFRFLGYSVSAGDINGDGIAEIVYGSPLDGPGTAGKVYAVYGQLANRGTLTSNQLESDISLGFSITGDGLGMFGYFVDASGDFNGDGYKDILIGCPTNPNGRAYVIFGEGGQLSNLETTPIFEEATDRGFVLTGIIANSGFGTSFSFIGDFNGDGLSDLAVGSPFASSSSGDPDGRAYIVFGRSTEMSNLHLPSLESAATADAFAIEGPSGVVSGAGDINDDGFDDVLLGSNLYSTTGFVCVLFGHDGPIQNLNLNAMTNQATADGFCVAGTTGTIVGASLSGIGDVNGDSIADFAFGAATQDVKGNMYVVFGRTTGFANMAIESWDNADGVKIIGSRSIDNFGSWIRSAGDINGDGFGDILVGAGSSSPFGRFAAGRTCVIFGGNNLANTDITSIYANPSTMGFSQSGSVTSEGIGSAVALSGGRDINGDGRPDILIGSPFWKQSQYKGRVYVLYG